MYDGFERMSAENNGMDFYRNKRVLVTGHTGFKGSWLCELLLKAGADVTGYSLAPSTEPALFHILGLQDRMESVTGDIRDFQKLKSVFAKVRPEIVFHLAAQPIVRESYKEPVYTYETNVMGTVYICECIRLFSCVRSFLNVTTDKVYQNREWEWGYREADPLDGYDPYSNSKSCSELVTHSYNRSFFNGSSVAASTARAGNVIGGGDFSPDRILPDCVRAALEGRTILVRNPHSVRPYQHVLEPLYAYLTIAAGQYEDGSLAGSYNIGPEDRDCLTTGELADLFCREWGEGIGWELFDPEEKLRQPHEANFLKLDCSRLRRRFLLQPRWDIKKAVSQTVAWSKAYRSGEDMRAVTAGQIEDFLRKG